jgi:hypothetical protein
MIGAFGSIEDRRVDRTQVDADVSVSTVHLVLDHSFGDGPPLIFETMSSAASTIRTAGATPPRSRRAPATLHGGRVGARRRPGAGDDAA